MTTEAYFIKPDGSHFLQVSLGGGSLTIRQPLTHPRLQDLVPVVNPAVTHLEFHRVLGLAIGGRSLYFVVRALQQIGPLINGTFLEVPLQEPPPVIVQLLDDFVDCAWTDDGALVAVDMHGRVQLRIVWGGHPLTQATKVLMLVDLLNSRLVIGGPPDDAVTLERMTRKARAR